MWQEQRVLGRIAWLLGALCCPAHAHQQRPQTGPVRIFGIPCGFSWPQDKIAELADWNQASRRWELKPEGLALLGQQPAAAAAGTEPAAAAAGPAVAAAGAEEAAAEAQPAGAGGVHATPAAAGTEAAAAAGQRPGPMDRFVKQRVSFWVSWLRPRRPFLGRA